MSWNKLWFSALMLLLAAMHKWMGLDNLSVGLGIAAGAPWILPELQGLVKSLKIAGVLDLELREMKEQLAAQKEALESGVGGKPEPAAAAATAAASSSGAGAPAPNKPLSFGATMAAEDLPEIDPSDPNKRQFGENPAADGLRLHAEVTPFPGSDKMFRVRAWVAAERDPKLAPGTKVRFHLHPTFRRRVLDAETGNDGIAAVNLVAWGAFTMGATVARGGQETRLELDLATEVPGAPEAFKAR